ncbi:MAG TPA: ATP-binding protein [Chthoniobacterales bacterium]|jgi:PAS domain S-box-containing protein
MIASAACLLYTQDDELVRRSRAFLRARALLRHVADPDRLFAVLEQNNPALLLIDLRARESRDLLAQVQAEWPRIVIIALGTPQSEPLREAEQSGVYAVEDLVLDRRRFQPLIDRALDHLRLLEENYALRHESIPAPANAATEPAMISSASSTNSAPATPLSVLRFARVLHRGENIDSLMNSVVEGLGDAAMVARVGLFSRVRQSERYRLRAGVRCLPETSELEYRERDPLVRWLEMHAHLVSRAHLSQVTNLGERQILRRALDGFGAEVIVPLHDEGRISGWLFFGHRITGQPFDYSSLEGLILLADHVSTVLANARLQEEVAVQKTLAETLLEAIPPGIVATDEEGIIRWFNPTAEKILGLTTDDVIGRPAEAVGSRLAGCLREALESDEAQIEERWIDPKTRHSISVQTRRLMNERDSLGAVAVIQDLTPEEELRQKQELTDRAVFWTDLAASMSHEVRNPLVAIKTFAQLLPERFDDPDFRRDFNEIVVQEIERLDRSITQINNFAHPPELKFRPVDLHAPVKRAVEMVRLRHLQNGFEVETALPDDLPKVVGDETALAEAFAHIVANAAEAISGQPKAHITLSAKPVRNGEHTSGVLVTVHDNGKGISEDLKDKIFSPFCTTKARGMGLGLPIVKRTVFDHNGRVDIDSNPQGTSVSVLLPAAENGA